MKKSDSLLKLMGMRLNTIAFKIMTDRASIKRFFKSIDQESKYSIRTERNEGEYELPFFYGKKVKELIPEIDGAYKTPETVRLLLEALASVV